jgi:O-antigen/teichoic acid export membrane protein
MAGVFALMGLLSSVTLAGLDTVIIRETSGSPERRGIIFLDSLTIRLAVSALVISAAVLWSLKSKDHPFALSLLILAPLLVFQMIGSTVNNTFNAMMLTKYSSISLAVSLVLATAARIIGIISDQKLMYFVVCYFAEYLIATVLIVCFFVRIHRTNPHQGLRGWRPSASRTKGYLQGAKWLLLSAVFAQLLQNMGIFVLTLKGHQDELGNFAAAIRLLAVAQFLPAVVGQVFIPALARLHDQESDLLPVFENQLFRSLALCGYLITIGCLAVGPIILPWLLGSQYHDASAIFCILSISSLPLAIGAARSAVFGKSRNYRAILISDLAGSATSLLLSFALISHFGAKGVAAGCVGGLFIAYFLMPILFMSRERGERSRFVSSLLHPIPKMGLLFKNLPGKP